jgi:hypothetical protein
MNERFDVNTEQAIQSLVDLLPIIAISPYVRMVQRGMMPAEDASECIHSDADRFATMNLAAPFVGYAVAKALREYAYAFVEREEKVKFYPILHRGGLDSDTER